MAPTPPDSADATREPRTRSRLVLGLLILLASAVVATTAYVLTHAADGIPRGAPVLFAGFVFAAVALAFLVGERLWQLWASSRARAGGSKLHGRLVAVLSAVTIIPALVAFALSGAALQAFAQNFFVERIEASNETARDFANSYFDAEAQRQGLKMLQLAGDLTELERSGRGPSAAPLGFRRWLLGQAILREFAAINLVDGEGRVLISVAQPGAPDYALPPPGAAPPPPGPGYSGDGGPPPLPPPATDAPF